jgi:Flp pilus assembly pilin Flp
MKQMNLSDETKRENELVNFLKNEDGVGVIELVLILVVLIGLVLIFKTQLTQILNNIFSEISKQSKEVY